jgi:hypothetical protein
MEIPYNESVNQLLIDVTVSPVELKYYSKIPLIRHFRKVVPETSSAFYKTKRSINETGIFQGHVSRSVCI